MLFFKTRAKIRAFVKNSGRKIIDNGPTAAEGRRWAVSLNK